MPSKFISRFLLAISFGILVSSCNRETKSVRSDAGANARMEKIAGVWQGKSKLIGGQGIAEVRIELKIDRTFAMEAVAAEKAHFLNAYPTLDQIRMAGKWSMDGDREILLDGKIEEFLRFERIGDAARNGFLADDKRGISETRLVPLPFEDSPSLRVGQDGKIHLDSIEFRGREADASDDDAWSRMIYYTVLEQGAK